MQHFQDDLCIRKEKYEMRERVGTVKGEMKKKKIWIQCTRSAEFVSSS